MTSDVMAKSVVNGRHTSTNTLTSPASPLHSPHASLHPTPPSVPSLVSYRKVHALLAPTAFVLLSFALITGEAYRFSRNALAYDKSAVGYLLSLHTLSLDKLHSALPALSAYYPLVTALILVPLIISGIILTFTQSWSLTYAYNVMTSSWRVTHRSYTLLAALPLLLTVVTGALWTLAHDWFAYAKADVHWLMYIHQGAYVANAAVYTTILTLVCLPVIISGAYMIIQWCGLCLYPLTSITNTCDGNTDGAETYTAIQRERSRYTLLSVNRAFEVDRLMAPLSNSSSEAEENTPDNTAERVHRYSR